MQVSAVTIGEVKTRLKITGTTDDARLEQMIGEAEDYVAAYIGRPLEEDGQVAPGLRGAVLAYVAFLADGTPVDLAGLLAPYRSGWF